MIVVQHVHQIVNILDRSIRRFAWVLGVENVTNSEVTLSRGNVVVRSSFLGL